ncbi:MAG: hypothetical protein ACOCX7_00645 [Bacteroidota bacterium]
MKKRMGIIFGLIVIAVVVVMLLLMDFPPSEEGKTSGTIGKVEKHRNVKIQGKDIELRTEFINDKEKLVASLGSLLNYYVYTNKTALILNNIKYDQLQELLPPGKKALAEDLRQLGSFIQNNNEKMKNTINTLAAAHKAENPPTGDIENLIIQVADFHMSYLDRNDAISRAVAGLDEVLANPGDMKKKELQELTRLRDALLMLDIETVAATGDKRNGEFVQKQKFVNSKEVVDTDKTFGVYSTPDLIDNKAFEGLNVQQSFSNLSEEQQKMFVSAFMSGVAAVEGNNIILSQGDLNLILATPKDLGILAKQDLNVVMAQDGLDLLVILNGAFLSKENLGIFLSQDQLNQFMASGELNMIFSEGQLNFLLANDNLASGAQKDLNTIWAQELSIVFSMEDLGVY